MTRRILTGTLALFCMAGFLHAQSKMTEEQILAKAKAIHEKVISIDTHVDIGGATYATPQLDPGTLTNRKCDLVKMKNGGLKAVFLAVFVSQGRGADHGLTPEG